MSSPELQQEKIIPSDEKIGFCTLREAGKGRLILAIPKEKFGNKIHGMRDIIGRNIFPSVHDGAYPAWQDEGTDSHLIEVPDREKAGQLVDKIEEWLEQNVKL